MGEQHLPVTKGYYVPKMIHQAVLLKVAERDKRKEKKKDDDVAQAEKRIKELFPSMEEEEAKKIINRGWSVGVGAQKTLFPPPCHHLPIEKLFRSRECDLQTLSDNGISQRSGTTEVAARAVVQSFKLCVSHRIYDAEKILRLSRV